MTDGATMKAKKLFKTLLIAYFCATTASMAETCPNLNGQKFNSLSDYNQYKNKVATQYTMPDMSGEIFSFPITFGQSEYAYLKSTQKIAKFAPFTGNQLSCYVSWTANYGEQLDTIIKIIHNVKTTSADWAKMDDQTAECDNPNGATACTFDRIN